jgi:iron uptake system EfeUOB component EfeO/EfeM
VTQLADAAAGVESGGVVYDIVNAELEKKQAELDKAQKTVYTI